MHHLYVPLRRLGVTVGHTIARLYELCASEFRAGAYLERWLGCAVIMTHTQRKLPSIGLMIVLSLILNGCGGFKITKTYDGDFKDPAAVGMIGNAAICHIDGLNDTPNKRVLKIDGIWGSDGKYKGSSGQIAFDKSHIFELVAGESYKVAFCYSDGRIKYSGTVTTPMVEPNTIYAICFKGDTYYVHKMKDWPYEAFVLQYEEVQKIRK